MCRSVQLSASRLVDFSVLHPLIGKLSLGTMLAHMSLVLMDNLSISFNLMRHRIGSSVHTLNHVPRCPTVPAGGRTRDDLCGDSTLGSGFGRNRSRTDIGQSTANSCSSFGTKGHRRAVPSAFKRCGSDPGGKVTAASIVTVHLCCRTTYRASHSERGGGAEPHCDRAGQTRRKSKRIGVINRIAIGEAVRIQPPRQPDGVRLGGTTLCDTSFQVEGNLAESGESSEPRPQTHTPVRRGLDVPSAGLTEAAAYYNSHLS
jgi:hypothetical protein